MTRVGDILTFPHHAEGRVIIRDGVISYSQGMPGYWRVLSLNPDGTPDQLKRVPDGIAKGELAENRRLSELLIPTTKQ